MTDAEMIADVDSRPCEDCGCQMLAWFAPNMIWNRVIGGPDAQYDPGGVLCPSCFIKRAERAGIIDIWKVAPSSDEDHAQAQEVSRARAEAERLSAENVRLRAALATSKDPCVYCQLPAAEIAKCAAGFPGCARMDDLMGCPELGARLELDDARAEAERLGGVCDCQHDALARIAQWADAYPRDVFTPLSDCDIKQIGQVVTDAGFSFDALHASWARHLIDGIGGIARTALQEQRDD